MSSMSSSSSSSSTQLKQSKFHIAAKEGKTEELSRLLNSKTELQLKDSDGNTPLHLAVKFGHYSTVELLLKMGASLRELNRDKYSPVDLAKIWGRTELAALFTENQESASFSHSFTNSLKKANPAPGRGRVGEMRKLFEPSTLSNQGERGVTLKSNSGRLRLFSQNSSSSSGQIINRNNPKQGSKGHDIGRPPSIMAPSPPTKGGVKIGPSKFTRQTRPFSVNAPRLPISNQDVGGQLYLAFEKAYDEGKLEEQISTLKKLHDYYMKRGDYLAASHLLNGAIALSNAGLNDPLLRKLQAIEEKFLLDKCKKKFPSNFMSGVAIHRQTLYRLRQDTLEKLVKRQQSSSEVAANFTRGYEALLCTLIEESIALIGTKPSVKFAVMTLGSMARDEACPYSDVEFAIVVESASKKVVDYFRVLSEFLTLRVTNLGETHYPLIRAKRGVREETSLTPSGFSIDTGGLVPAGKKGVYELIGTPTQLAHFQTKEWTKKHEAEVILSNAMTTVKFLVGSKGLVKGYRSEVKKVLSAKWGTAKGGKLRHPRALELLKGCLSEFQPRLDTDKIKLRAFDVKNELYRPIQTIIRALSLYYGVESRETLGRIDGLWRRGVISSAGKKRLKSIFTSILRLRIKTHLFYQTEQEILYYSEEKANKRSSYAFCDLGLIENRGMQRLVGAFNQAMRTQEEVGCFFPKLGVSTVTVAVAGEDELFAVTPLIKKAIVGAYMTLVPLHMAAKRWAQGDPSLLRKSALLDPRVGEYNDQERQEYQFSSAMGSATTRVALDPNRYSGRWDLAIVQKEVGKYKKSISQFKETLRLLKVKHGNSPHTDIADNLANLGSTYFLIGEYRNGIESLQAALTMYREIHKVELHSSIANCLNGLGNAYRSLGDYVKAIDHLQRSLKIYMELDDDLLDIELALATMNLGVVHLDMGEAQSALQRLNASLAILGNSTGKPPLKEIATASMHAGNACKLGMNLPGAVKYYEQALKLSKQVYQGKPHPSVANVLAQLGSTRTVLKEYTKAHHHFKLALSILTDLYGEGMVHPQIASTLSMLGMLHHFESKHLEAIKILGSALKMQRKFYGATAPTHPDIAETLNNLGFAYCGQHQYKIGIKHFEESLSIKRKLYGSQSSHSAILSTLLGLAGAHKQLGNQVKANEYLLAAGWSGS